MSYLELLSWARKGIKAEQDKHREMQEKAIEGQAHDMMRYCQDTIDRLDVKLAALDELEKIHNRS